MELPRRQAFVASIVALSGSRAPAVDLPDIGERDPVVVVGGGPSGLRVAQEVARRGLPVVLFNAERWPPYNRVKLTPFLAGEVQIGRVYQENVFAPGAFVTQYDCQRIVTIDRAAKTVVNQFGRRWRYSKLVLCLGSRPHIPPIPGRELSGVFRFRDFDDVEKLVARTDALAPDGGDRRRAARTRSRARHVAAQGHTMVVEHERHLMVRQLDHAGGILLQRQIERMGIDVRTGCAR